MAHKHHAAARKDLLHIPPTMTKLEICACGATRAVDIHTRTGEMVQHGKWHENTGGGDWRDVLARSPGMEVPCT